MVDIFRLTADQLAAIDYAAGFRGQSLTTIIAIQLSESGGNIYAHNTSGEDSRGISQINVAPGAHPDLAGLDLFDPFINALQAFHISSGGADYTAWTTYTRGSYLANMGAARSAAMNVQNGAASPDAFAPGVGVTLVGLGGDLKGWLCDRLGPAGDYTTLCNPKGGLPGHTVPGENQTSPGLQSAQGAAGSLGGIIGALGDPSTWRRLLLTLGAAILIVLGVLVFTRPKMPAAIPIPV